MDLSSIFSADSEVPSPVSSTIWTRLHALWLVGWTCLMMIPFSIGVVAAYRRRPDLSVFKRWVERYAGYALRGAGIRVRTIGRKSLDPDQPYIFIANHQCALDILAHGVGIPHPFGYLAKENLRSTPVLGYVLEHTPSILVDATNPVRAVRSLEEVGERVGEGHSVLIYAEGLRTFSRELSSFKRGGFVLAVSAGVPIVPVTLIDAYRLVDERRLRSRPGTVHLHIGDPIPVDGLTKDDVPALMEQVRTDMERVLAGDRVELSAS